jgi:hypothetical protein
MKESYKCQSGNIRSKENHFIGRMVSPVLSLSQRGNKEGKRKTI